MGTSGFKPTGSPEFIEQQNEALRNASESKCICDPPCHTKPTLGCICYRESVSRNIELKCDPVSFVDILENLKKLEIRKDDREYAVGDTLTLFETKFTGEEMAMGAPLVYTGRKIIRIVTHVLPGGQYGLAQGYVALSIRPVWGPQ